MIGVGKAKQYANVLDKPLSRGRQEVRGSPRFEFPSGLHAHGHPGSVLVM